MAYESAQRMRTLPGPAPIVTFIASEFPAAPSVTNSDVDTETRPSGMSILVARDRGSLRTSGTKRGSVTSSLPTPTSMETSAPAT